MTSGTLAPATVTGPTGAGALLTTGAGPVAGALLSRLDVEHPALSGLRRRTATIREDRELLVELGRLNDESVTVTADRAAVARAAH
jgi:hypothetical protein